MPRIDDRQYLLTQVANMHPPMRRSTMPWHAFFQCPAVAKEARELREEIDRLWEYIEKIDAEMVRREEAAYRHGLGDAEVVYDQNRILAATIRALTDRLDDTRLREVPNG